MKTPATSNLLPPFQAGNASSNLAGDTSSTGGWSGGGGAETPESPRPLSLPSHHETEADRNCAPVQASCDYRFAASGPEIDAFLALVVGGDGCWTWTGGTSGGRPWFSFRGGGIAGHRWAFGAVTGRIPGSGHVHHTCFNSGCVRGDHLVALSGPEHRRAHGLAKAAANAAVRSLMRAAGLLPPLPPVGEVQP